MKKPPKQINFARELRQNQTDAEKALWAKLRTKQISGVKFRRQQPIGPYIADFVSFEKKLIIEVDGGQHNENENHESDETRSKWLKSQGFQIIRFWNNDVLKNMEGVLESINEVVSEKMIITLTLPSPIEGEDFSSQSEKMRFKLQKTILISPVRERIYSPSPRGRELEGGGRQ